MPGDAICYLAFRKENPERYDLIVFRQGGDEHMYYDIKRVIGLPGETIQIKDGEGQCQAHLKSKTQKISVQNKLINYIKSQEGIEYKFN